MELVAELETQTAIEAPNSKTIRTADKIQSVDKLRFTGLNPTASQPCWKQTSCQWEFFAHHIDVREPRVYTKRDTGIELEIYHLTLKPPH